MVPIQPGGQLQEPWEAWKTPPLWQGGMLGQEKPKVPSEQDSSQLGPVLSGGQRQAPVWGSQGALWHWQLYWQAGP